MTIHFSLSGVTSTYFMPSSVHSPVFTIPMLITVCPLGTVLEITNVALSDIETGAVVSSDF